MKNLLFISALLSLIFISCKKEKTPEEEAFVGGIIVTTPAANDTISGTYSILTGNITGNMELHGYHVILTKVSDNSVLAEYNVDQHSQNITLNDTINYIISGTTPVKLRVESAYNHEGDLTVKEVLYVVQP